MIVLSIDVGIKNLGFCLFDVNENKEFKIIAWDSLNLIDNQQIQCQFINAKQKKCSCKAKYEKNNEFYCKKHAKMHKTYIIPDPELNFIKIKKLKLNELISLKDKFHIPIPENVKITKSLILESIQDFINDKYFVLVNETKSVDVNLVTLGKNMMKEFDIIFKNYKIDKVLIENQISPIANRMKTIQGMITQYFIMKNIDFIEFISSFNKLKLWVHKKTTYNERKKLSINIVKQLIDKNNSLLKWQGSFLLHKKKDDLADSLLQGLWYLFDKNLIQFDKNIKLS